MDKWGQSVLSTLANGLLWRSELYLYKRSLEPSSSDRQAVLPADVTYLLVNQENVGLIRDWRGVSEAARFQRFLNRGDIGVYAMAGGEVIHYDWASLRLPGHVWSWTTHDPIELGDALLHRGYTREDYRRRGVGSYAVMYITALLREQYYQRGMRHVCALVHTDNLPPQRVLTELGFRRTQQLSLVRLLGTVCMYWVRPPDMPAGAGSPLPSLVRLKIPEIVWDSRLTVLRTLLSRATLTRQEAAS